MTTRPWWSRRAPHALGLALALCGTGLRAQPRPATAGERYGVEAWGAPSPSRVGVTLSWPFAPGLSLRARIDRVVDDGGIELAYGPPSRSTLGLRIAVAPDALAARHALLGYLQGVQGTMVPLRDRHGADVAFGDQDGAPEAAAAVFGNVAVWIARTHDAGPETPSADRVLAAFARALGPEGSPSFPSPTLAGPATPVGGRAIHVALRSPVEHLEVRARGGYLRGPAGPSGVDVVPSGRGPLVLVVVATDALGRSAGAEFTVLTTTNPTPTRTR